jgi:hypothetical protein
VKRRPYKQLSALKDALVTGLYVVAGCALLFAVGATSGLVHASEALADAAGVITAASPSPGAASPTAVASPTPSPGVSQTLTTSVLRDVTVHSGQYATVSYRADDSAGGTVTVDLLVTTQDGTVVRRLVTGRTLAVGAGHEWRGRLRLRRGRYLLVAHAADASGQTEASAQTAKLSVLAELPPLAPTERARRAAFAWAARRAGVVAVAVIDSRGHLYGYHPWRRFTTASVVKAMILVTYLRQHRTVSPAMRSVLTRMITVSDNSAADLTYRLVGRSAVQRLAHLAHMRSFTAGGAWIVSRVAPADMARFFRDMEQYIPSRHRRFANGLLSHIVSFQSWGIPAAAEASGYRVYFKPGWLGAWILANEAARLERKRVTIGLAVFTDDNPSSSYGKETIAGVTARLLRR